MCGKVMKFLYFLNLSTLCSNSLRIILSIEIENKNKGKIQY